jgi:hypothetical protein
MEAILRGDRVTEQISGYKTDIDNCLQRFQVQSTDILLAQHWLTNKLR